MKYAFQMGSDVKIYIPSVIKIGVCIQKYMKGIHRRHGAVVNLLQECQVVT
jgi:hypothetical protein